MVHITVIDSDTSFTKALKTCFEAHSWEVEAVTDWAEISIGRCSRKTDVMVVAISGSTQARREALRALQAVHELNRQVDIILGAVNFTIEDIVQGIQSGIKEFIKKTSLSCYIETIYKIISQKKRGSNYLIYSLDIFIQNHCKQASFSIIDVCQNFQLSSSYISKLFHTYMRTSFRRRVIFYRVQNAKNLIENTSLSLRIIAERCGFKNQHRLTESFKKVEGVPPQKYRENFKR